MKLDFKSLAFGYSLTNGVSTPAWETSLGQGFGYKLNNLDTIDELVKGMIYKAVAPKTISFKKGRGGATVQGDADNASLVIAAVFDKVFVNEQQIHGGQFVLLIVKDDAESHKGRLKLKYGLDNTYTNSDGVATKNRDFHSIVTQQLGLANDACWFVYDISVENQDILRLRTIFVNNNGPMTYANSSALHSAWDALIDADLASSNISDQTESDDIELIADDIPDDLSVDDLGAILANMYNSAPEGNQSNAIRMFGVKYGGLITEKGYTATAITNASGIDTTSYSSEVSKGISIYKSIKENTYGIRFYEDEEINSEDAPATTAFDFDTIRGTAINKIFFGTPGCGKSHHIDHKILGKSKETKEYSGDYLEKNIIRTTFYQDYSNTDFVGQILPRIEKDERNGKETVRYIFNPGPFALALIRAISNPDKKVALVIEEINRGNAPAIFGDIFQLLDRDDYGVSEYGIVNVGLMDYLNSYEFDVNGEKKRYTFSEIKLPGNLDIFATMNTSDQNVYTLDTAFIRRWDREKMKNSFAECKFAADPVPGMPEYTWEEFVNSINEWIEKHLEELQINEDKQIGAFFIKKSLLSKKPEEFAYKVFDYLWSDVAKLDHGVIFNKYDTLEKLIKAYASQGVKVFKPGIFADKSAVTQEVDSNE